MNRLIQYIKKGSSQYQLTKQCIDDLSTAGFVELNLYDKWQLEEGGKYYVSPFPSVLFSFVIGSEPKGIRIATSHVDFPSLKVKTNPTINQNGYTKVNVEPYGGLILNTWFDRPLGIAGKIILKGSGVFNPTTILYDSLKPLFVIPSLAPHMRNKEKVEIEIQKEVIPIFSINNSNISILDYISNELSLSKEQILDFDLYLYNCDEPKCLGANNDLLLSPRMDNITSVVAIMEALLDDNVGDCIIMGAFFDNEEIGSRSKQGADSVLLKTIMDKLLLENNISKNISWNNNFMISLDVAQGYHPNYPEKFDITNLAILGEGIVIKTSASQRYLTDSEASAVIKQICTQNNIKLQTQVNKSGMPGGQTLGPITSSYIPIKGVDMGVPMLAMHSAAEVIALEDFKSLKELVKIYYGMNY